MIRRALQNFIETGLVASEEKLTKIWQKKKKKTRL